MTTIKKVFNYFKHNLKGISIAFLLAIAFVFLALPSLIRLVKELNLANRVSPEYFIGILALAVIVAILCWRFVNKYLMRYIPTLGISTPPFTGLNYLLLIVIFALIISTAKTYLLAINTSYLVTSFVIFLIIWLVSAIVFRSKEQAQIVMDDLQDIDNPIRSKKEDTLGREKFIDDLSKEILSNPSKESFTIGLYGHWGEGKTSVLNLLFEKLKDEKSLILVNFDPWHFSNEDAIVSAFYNQLEQVINDRYLFSNLRRVFRKYQKLIMSGIAQAGLRLDFKLEEESLAELRYRIESHIEQLDKRLLIAIDDIDRLQPQEMLAIFKIVRLNANFKNVVFFLSFDPEIVERYLETSQRVDREFLEKIIQRQIRLPAIAQENIDQFIDKSLDKLFDEINMSQDQRDTLDSDFVYLYQTKIRHLFITLRSAKRFLASVRFSLPAIYKEVNLSDSLILEIIKVFYPEVYDDIWERRWLYIPLEWSNSTAFTSPLGYMSNESEKYKLIKEQLEPIISKQKKSEILKDLLETIFFVNVKNAFSTSPTIYSGSSYRANKRITHPESFVKYFMLKVPVTQIPDDFVLSIIEAWNSKKDLRAPEIKKTLFENQKQEMLRELLTKLVTFLDKISKETALDLIKVIYENADQFSMEGERDLWNSEFSKARLLLFILVDEKVEETQIQSTLEKIVLSTPSIRLAVNLVLSCKSERGGSRYNIYGNVTLDGLTKKLADRLKQYYVDDKHDIFAEYPDRADWRFILYQWSTNWEVAGRTNFDTVNSYLETIFTDNPKRLAEFIYGLRSKNYEGKLVFDLEELSKAYDFKKLQNLAKKHKNQKNFSEEERAAISAFLDVKINGDES